jgi:hypothetical protein
MFAYSDLLIACFLLYLAIAISERRDDHDNQKIQWFADMGLEKPP